MPQNEQREIHSPYCDADLIDDIAERGQSAVTIADAVLTYWTGHLTPLTQVEAQMAE